MKRIVCLTLVAASLAGAVTPASARDGWNGAVLGAAGGLALGAALANPYPRPVYVAPPPVYVAPRPVYVESVDEAPVCFFKRRRYIDEYGDEVIRRIRVCE